MARRAADPRQFRSLPSFPLARLSSRWSRLGRWLFLGLAGLALVLVGAAVHAQSPSPNQPLAIDGALPPDPCPLVVPTMEYALQPLRIQPSQVAAKNAMGCLSPADALEYGPDGCPVKLCQMPQGTVPLPQL